MKPGFNMLKITFFRGRNKSSMNRGHLEFVEVKSVSHSECNLLSVGILFIFKNLQNIRTTKIFMRLFRDRN